MKNTEKTMDKIVELCKSRGFVFPGSEIYGGLANTWDYGPLGVLLKNNIKAAWLRKFVQECKYNVGLDSAILMNPQTWVASGHIGGFSDPLMDCKECKTRHRADNLIEAFDGTNPAGWTNEQMMDYIREHNIPCPNCGKHNFTDIRQFNLMFKTFQGVTEDSKSEIYLRPETAQGIFVNFANIQRTTRKKIPFGVAQVGKSFCKNWLLSLGIKEENLRLRDHDPEELCFYSKATTDFEFLFPFGWGELWGVADRTDYDLTQHIKTSGKTLDYFDPETNERYVPYVIEPSLGVERLFLSVLTDAYDEENLGTEEKPDVRTVLRIHPALAPFKAAILPLSKKLSDKAWEIHETLCKKYSVDFDDAGSIGKRYRREDEIGTPLCITYDFDSETDGQVTVRDRDTMEQIRLPIDQLDAYIASKIDF